MNRITSVIAMLLLVMLTGCTQIDTGNVGVVKTGGQLDPEELQPGWHATWFSSVYEVSAKENAIQFNDMQPKTADQITVQDLDIDVYYKINPAKAQELMVKLAGDLDKNKDGDSMPGYNYVGRTAREAVYNTMARIKASEAQSRRATIPADILSALQKELDTKLGAGWVTVTNVNLRNLTVDRQLEAAIRAAAQVQYEIEAKQKQVELAKAEAERQQAIAKGEAERTRIVAQGEADSVRIRAEGLRTTQGAEYLRMMELQNQADAIKRWDGKLPTTVAQGAMPMIDVKK